MSALHESMSKDAKAIEREERKALKAKNRAALTEAERVLLDEALGHFQDGQDADTAEAAGNLLRKLIRIGVL